MKNNLTPRYLIILVILGWSFYTLWPTIQYQNLTDDEISQIVDDIVAALVKDFGAEQR